ncbi:MAG: energy-coupling factor transporter transmembrane protein EcfT [Anaerolineae bacterium]|nr:energy-coupling factor transporter transmembrane protein EcfT [Anaerolineae bacterium]
MRHPVAWVLWTVSSATAALLTRNPLYLILIALAAWFVYLVVGQSSSLARSWQGLLKLGALIWLVTIPFNALMIHHGTHVLFTLPKNWPLLGGAITLEAVVMGLVSGFALWTLLLIFAAFNTAVDASLLLRLVPPFFYQAGVVASIGLTFVPQMLLSAQEIREAQRIRGHRFRSWRDFLPLLMPLLTTAFEHAIQLAESMEARGFGGGLTNPAEETLLRRLLLASLSLVLGGLALPLLWEIRIFGELLLLLAGGIFFYALYRVGRHVQRSHYRRLRWTRSSSLIALSSAATLLGIGLIYSVDRAALTYYPYQPSGLLPPFEARIGFLLSLLALPGLVSLFEEAPSASVPLQTQGNGGERSA